METVLFGGGCFWCTEAVFSSLKGIVSVVSGYAGGQKLNPTYEEVSSGVTGYAEVIKIEYNPAIISFDDLLAVFFYTHDPTTPNQQGNDIGEQYRSVVYYTTPTQKAAAERTIEELTKAKAYEHPIVTKIEQYTNFYPAEDYHKKYYENNKSAPYCRLVIAPKMEKLKKRFEKLMKANNL